MTPDEVTRILIVLSGALFGLGGLLMLLALLGAREGEDEDEQQAK